MAQSSDFYSVLGIERAADEREIKKAYFRLVRQFPPETHPEEFKRVREAYEVLQNPDARKEYDDLTQYGEEIGQHLRAGMEAMDRGDLRFAQTEFKQVLMLQPELHLARDLLGMAYLNNGQPREALSQFTLLCGVAPEGATHHLHLGYAHYALDEYPEALAAHLEARRLDPADTRIRVALADCYTAMERYDDALGELDQAIHRDHEAGPEFQDFVLMLRKVQIQLLRDRVDLADQEVEGIAKVLPEDPEVRKYVSQKLASLAAQLFRIKRSADGNRLLRRAQELGRGRKSAGLVFPAWVSRPLRDLPPASRAQLLDLAQRPSPHKLLHGVWAGPVLLLLLALGVVCGGVYEALTSRTEWHGNAYTFMALLLLGGPVLLYQAGMRVLRVLRSRIGRFTTLHPLYLLQADVDRVTAWPLVNLHDVSMTHHLQNGVYQYTAVKADFAGVPLTLTIRGQQAAVDWAQALLDARHRCLGLLAVGMLEEEEGYDILPPEVLSGQPPPVDRKVRTRALRGYAAAVLAGAALLAAGTVANTQAAERAAWEDTVIFPRATTLRRYLLLYPGGPHADQAQRRLVALYDEAKARYQRQAGEGNPQGREALLAVLEALKTAPSEDVPVRYSSQVDFSSLARQSAADDATVIPPERAFTDALNRRRELAITQALGSALERLLPPDVLTLSRGEGDERPRGGVVIDVSYTVTPSDQVYHLPTDESAFSGVRFAWTLRVRTPQRAQPFTFELASQPAQSIRYQRSPYGYDDDTRPYAKMAESAFDEFGRKVGEIFGVPVQSTARPDQDGVTSLRRLLMNLSRQKAPHKGARHGRVPGKDDPKLTY